MKKKSFITMLVASVLSVVMSASLLVGCARGGGSALPDGFVSETSGAYGTVQWDYYSDPTGYFKVEIPRGWSVSTDEFKDQVMSGTNQVGSLHVSIKNPEGTLGVQLIDHYNCYLSSLSSPTVQALFKEVIYSPSYNKGITSFEIVGEKTIPESMRDFANSANGSNVRDYGRYRDHFVQNGVEGEGEVECVILGYPEISYVVAGLCIVSIYATPMGEFDKWQPVLDRIRNSFSFGDAYQARYGSSNSNNNNGTAYNGGYTAITPGGATGNPYEGLGDGLMDSWNARNKSEDIYNQKRQDALFGNQRVQDNDTGAIYNADQSWYDQYSKSDGQRYSPIDDDQYLSGTDGTVGW